MRDYTTLQQAARIQEGCEMGEEGTEHVSALPWVLLTCGFWIIVALTVLS